MHGNAKLPPIECGASQGSASSKSSVSAGFQEPELHYFRPDGTDQVFGLGSTPGTITVGRSRSNQIVIDEVLVSSHHAVVHLGSGYASWEDVGSKHGSSVNGIPLLPEERRHLHDGDTIFLGDAVLTFVSYSERLQRALRATEPPPQTILDDSSKGVGSEDIPRIELPLAGDRSKSRDAMVGTKKQEPAVPEASLTEKHTADSQGPVAGVDHKNGTRWSAITLLFAIVVVHIAVVLFVVF